MNKIKSLEYPGSIQNFHALMKRLSMFRRGMWEINSRKYTIYIWQDENIGTLRIWDIQEHLPKSDSENDSKQKPRIASVIATEKFQDRTLIEFIDGVSSVGLRRGLKEDRPIGDDFHRIIDEIIAEWQNKNSEEILREPQTRNLKDWFDYFHAVEHRMKIPMGYIAERTQYGINTVYKEHTIYMREHGITKDGKVRKSKKK